MESGEGRKQRAVNCQGSGGRAGTAGFRRQGSGFRNYLGEEISNTRQFLNPEPCLLNPLVLPSLWNHPPHLL
jgi:hypothetical protein